MNGDNFDTKTPETKATSSEREKEKAHPQQEDSPGTENVPFDATSLIESAARSILDEKSPSTAVSDDEGDEEDKQYEILSQDLRSLQREKLPAMPDEQDRKRFVGCLAAILASSYDFEEIDDDDDLIEANVAESMAYMTINDDEHDESFHHPMNGSFEHSETSADLRRGTSSSNFGKIRVSRSRHRKRRYDILSRLLLASSEYLLLEKSQAKAFLPMLAKLLSPQPKQAVQDNQTGRNFSFSSKKSNDRLLEQVKGAPIDEFAASDDILNKEIDEIEYLRPFLESMTPGSGFRCVALLLLQYLLCSQEGYDARIRKSIKTLGVLAIAHDLRSNSEDLQESRRKQASRRKPFAPPDWVTIATHKFESLEHCIASKLIALSKEQTKQDSKDDGVRDNSGRNVLTRQPKGLSREEVMRGIKIGGAGLVAGTLFALTGGLAAPGIAAAAAAVAGGTAATAAAAAMLTSTAAVTAIFGVGGGSLAAYKMQRRTQGLTEFEFQKETGDLPSSVQGRWDTSDAELFSTICFSGWLRDRCDFQRPWGVHPSRPLLLDRQELLERFYVIYKPDHIIKVSRILASWKGEENELWSLLRQKYGRDPDHVFPLDDGPRYTEGLILEEVETMNQLFVELGYVSNNKSDDGLKNSPFEKMREGWKLHRRETRYKPKAEGNEPNRQLRCCDSLHGPQESDSAFSNSASGLSQLPSESNDFSNASASEQSEDGQHEQPKLPKHISTVWDYQANYGGEMYTIRWESDLLTELCDSVSDLAFDLVSGSTTRLLLSHTALSALMSAVAWPIALVNAANLIDGTWTLAVERADEAGKELARSLLFSKAGHRPVTLVGYSFGARAIYSCLKELAKYQEQWENFHNRTESQRGGFLFKNENATFSGENEDFFRYMREPASIVEDAILMGMPNHLSLSSWKVCRQIVAGRLVNCFSQKDLILSLMFQVKRFGMKPVCGTCPVAVAGVENIDVSDLVKGHQDYCLVTGQILKRVRHCQPFRSRPTRSFDVNIDTNEDTWQTNEK